MKILVTGNAGFIGQYLASALLNQGHEVVGLDKRDFQDPKGKIKQIKGNILDADAVKTAMSGTELVINLAAEHQDWGITRDTYFEVNQLGTRTLLDCAAELSINTFVFYSSVAVYGTSVLPTTESTMPRPDNDYGASKLAAEKEVETWCHADPARCGIIVRPTAVFGPRMNDYSNIYRLIDQIAHHRFMLIGPMTNTKSLAYVENLVDATLFLLDHTQPGIHLFNAAEQDHLMAREIALYISKQLRTWLPETSLPYKPLELAASVLDLIADKTRIDIPITAARIRKVNTPTHHKSDKLHQAGFTPQCSIREALSKTCGWYAAQQKRAAK